ncbi:ribose 5-phosphate isomerase B [Puniceicoccaceae bacterium K14]|nr:ribose 5-phosphate isomerase B [Puniceicoccaceae bacterium K14]
MSKLTIAIGSDHAGYTYKQAIIEHLNGQGFTVKDYGTDSTESCDYPDFIRPVAEAVANGEYDRGIVLGGSGNGEAIAANRVPGVRCGLCWNEQVAIWNREHNDGNVLSIGERTISQEEALKIVDTWLATEFEGGRHVRRIEKVDAKRYP